MNKAEAKRIAHLIAHHQINNFIDVGGCVERWPEKDALKVEEALRVISDAHGLRAGDAHIPSEADRDVSPRNSETTKG